MSQTYDNKAITGADLETILASAASEIKKKQDIIDAEYDAANGMIVLNNIDISVASST